MKVTDAAPFPTSSPKTARAMGAKVPQRVRTNSPRSSKIRIFSEAHGGVTEGIRVPVEVAVGVGVRDDVAVSEGVNV
jgi:hypothetical protein